MYFKSDDFKHSFPLFSSIEGHQYVYADNAATTQKPNKVIQALEHYYQQMNANVHRAGHQLSAKATKQFEMARSLVSQFINANCDEEIIWTKGTTESINLVANAWGRENVKADDEIIVSYAEHHANIVPWQLLAQSVGANIKVVNLDSEGRIDIAHFESLLSSRTKLVAVHHISNVIGKVNDITAITSLAKQNNAVVLIDAAQSIAHVPIDVHTINCDFLVFSGHKMYGPTGIGVLYGKYHLLDNMKPYQAGGEMIEKVSFTGTTFNKPPFKFEAGTPNISGVIGLAAAIKFIQDNQLHHQRASNNSDLQSCYTALSQVENLNFLYQGVPDVGIFSFTIEGQHSHDIGSYLDAHNIAVRVGHHCAMPLMEHNQLPGCVRVSLAPYNTVADMERIASLLKKVQQNDEQVFELVNNETAEHPREQLLAKFSKLKGWDTKHREIMLLGKAFQRLDDSLKNTENQIVGCESDAWLVVKIDANNYMTFQGDSNAKVVRGLMSIIFTALDKMTPEQVVAFDIAEFLQQMGLMHHLSPSRGNGVKAIVEHIKQTALSMSE